MTYIADKLRRELVNDVIHDVVPRRDIIAAVAEIDRLRAALEWYANPEIYRPHPHGLAFDNRDLSFSARAALTQEQP